MSKYDLIVFPDDYDEKKKEIARQYIEWIKKRDYSVCVIYNPDCGCKVDQFVILDRFPMSKKIISSCPECKKGCLMEISNPPIFYDQLNKIELTLKELQDVVIANTWQQSYLEWYKEVSKRSENMPYEEALSQLDHISLLLRIAEQSKS